MQASDSSLSWPGPPSGPGGLRPEYFFAHSLIPLRRPCLLPRAVKGIFRDLFLGPNFYKGGHWSSWTDHTFTLFCHVHALSCMLGAFCFGHDDSLLYFFITFFFFWHTSIFFINLLTNLLKTLSNVNFAEDLFEVKKPHRLCP